MLGKLATAGFLRSAAEYISSAIKLEQTASQSFPLHMQLRLSLMAERHMFGMNLGFSGKKVPKRRGTARSLGRKQAF